MSTQPRSPLRTTASLTPALAMLVACNNPAFYEGAQVLRVTADDIAAASEEDSMTGNPTIGAYVQSEYWLDFRAPTDAELAELQPAGTPIAEQRPWVGAGEVTAAIPWTLTNDSDAPITAWVLLDGATEFYDYDPISTYGAAGGEDEEEIQYPSLAGFTPRQLAPGEVMRGEFREDDLREAIYDLDGITRYCAGPLAVLNHRHEADPIGTDVIPDDAPLASAVMLRLTLGADGPATLEYAVRLRESGGKVFDSMRDDARYETMPEPYALPGGGAAAPMGMEPAAPGTEQCNALPAEDTTG